MSHQIQNVQASEQTALGQVSDTASPRERWENSSTPETVNLTLLISTFSLLPAPLRSRLAAAMQMASRVAQVKEVDWHCRQQTTNFAKKNFINRMREVNHAYQHGGLMLSCSSSS